MKRDGGSVERLAVHEMGHVAVGHAQDLITVVDTRWSTHGFTFTAVDSESNWSDYDRKLRTIGAQVAVALGGGAAEVVVLGGLSPREIADLTFADVLDAGGTIDVQLAMEWLGLQRYDPSQDSVETEVVEVFQAVAHELARSANRETLRQLAGLFVRERGTLGRDVTVRFNGSGLEAACAALELSASYPLRHTITPRVTAETTTTSGRASETP